MAGEIAYKTSSLRPSSICANNELETRMDRSIRKMHRHASIIFFCYLGHLGVPLHSMLRNRLEQDLPQNFTVNLRPIALLFKTHDNVSLLVSQLGDRVQSCVLPELVHQAGFFESKLARSLVDVEGTALIDDRPICITFKDSVVDVLSLEQAAQNET